jgi:hypothetical protein
MKLPDGLQLYRGLGGLMDLPDRFWAADRHGCRGYVEWGFLSTTSNRATAIEYSGVKDGRPLAMLLQLTVGSVDRGACIAEFSQYPGEVCGPRPAPPNLLYAGGGRAMRFAVGLCAHDPSPSQG